MHITPQVARATTWPIASIQILYLYMEELHVLLLYKMVSNNIFTNFQKENGQKSNPPRPITLHLAMDTLLHHTIEMSFYLEEYHSTNKSLKIVAFILIVQPILQSKIIGGWSKLVDKAIKQGKIMLQQFTINSISFQGV